MKFKCPFIGMFDLNNTMSFLYSRKPDLLQWIEANRVLVEMIEFYHDDQHKIPMLVFDMDHRIYNYYLNHHICPRTTQTSLQIAQ